MDFPTNTVSAEELQKIIGELNTWCMNYRGFINQVFSEQVTMEEKVTKLFWCVKQIAETQEGVVTEWSELYDWVDNYFKNLNLQPEVDKKLEEMAQDGTLEKIINQEIFGELNTKIDKNVEDITALGNRVTTNENSIKSLGNRVTTTENDINSVEAKVANLETRKPINMLKKRFVLIADSYGEYDVFDGFINVMNGTIVESVWKGGAGFTKTGEQSFLNMMNALPNHNDVDYVVVFGLYNDSFDVNNLVNKIIEFKNRAIVKYPGAEIVVVNQGWSKDVSLQGQFQYLIDTVTNGFAAGSVTVIHTWKYLHVYSRIAVDKIHPASNLIGNMLGGLAGKILSGGNLNFCFPIVQISPTYINGWQAYGGTTAPYQEMNDSECLLHFVDDVNHYGIDAGTNIKCNGSNYVEIMQFPKNSGCVIGSGDMLLNIPCILGLTNGTYKQASCTLEVYDSKLRIRPYLLNSAGNDFETIQLNSIQWTPCTIRSNINNI